MTSSNFPSKRIPQDGVIIEFPDTSPRIAGTLAHELKAFLDNAVTDKGAVAKTSVEKVDENAQDVGTILAIILGAEATIALAAGISEWLRRRNQGKIRIVKPDGSYSDIQNVDSDDMAKIITALK